MHVFADAWGLNPSPFCLKIETYCRLAGIPFVSVPTLPFRAPRGKLPFIKDGTLVVPDSGLIIEHLERTRTITLDEGLDADQRALGHLLRRTCEESLYFALVYARWIDPDGWRMAAPAFFGTLPPVLRQVVPALARRGVRRALIGQGFGRHSPEEVYRLGADDLAAVARILGRSEFAVGSRPSSFDASVYGVLANIIAAPVETPLKELALRHGALTDYVGRMRALLA